MILKIDFKYEETQNEEERIRKVSDILAQGIYNQLKKEGLLQINHKRKEKIQELIDKTREITRREPLLIGSHLD